MTVDAAQLKNKAKILDAASALFLKGGVSALSVRAIAANAGVSTIGIYSHFKGKDGLLEALYIEGFAKISDAMKVDASESPRAAALSACERYLDIAENFPAHYQLIFGDAGADYTPSETARAASIDAFNGLLTFTEILLPAEISSERKQKKALEIWAMLHGFVSLKRLNVGDLMPTLDWRAAVMESVEKQVLSTSP